MIVHKSTNRSSDILFVHHDKKMPDASSYHASKFLTVLEAWCGELNKSHVLIESENFNDVLRHDYKEYGAQWIAFLQGNVIPAKEHNSSMEGFIKDNPTVDLFAKRSEGLGFNPVMFVVRASALNETSTLETIYELENKKLFSLENKHFFGDVYSYCHCNPFIHVWAHGILIDGIRERLQKEGAFTKEVFHEAIYARFLKDYGTFSEFVENAFGLEKKPPPNHEPIHPIEEQPREPEKKERPRRFFGESDSFNFHTILHLAEHPEELPVTRKTILGDSSVELKPEHKTKIKLFARLWSIHGDSISDADIPQVFKWMCKFVLNVDIQT